MLIGSDILLRHLPPYNGNKKTLVYDQNVDHVIDGLVKAVDDYKNHYNNIWQFFAAPTVEKTAENVWKFLKKNSDYVIEPDTRQSIKTPAAILATAKKDKGGNDCKNFSLFTAGVLRAYREHTGEKFDLFLRFAGYNGSGLRHVFVVVKKNNKEIWIDPVLQNFDDRSYEPSRVKNYKINNMALVSLSGIDPFENNKAIFDNKPQPVPGVVVGATFPTFSPDTFKNVKTLQFLTKAQKSVQQIAPVAPKGAQVATSLLSAGASAATGNFLSAGVQLVSALSNLFGGKDAPGDYWKAWERIDQQYGNPIGASAQHWIWRDGDSVQNEALNIISYIQNNDPDLTKVLSPNSTTLRDRGKYITFDDLIDKLRRGGYSREADEIKKVYNSLLQRPDSPGSTKAGMNMLITLGLVGAAAFFLLRKK